MHSIKIKRAYEEASSDDGKRILVDRYWPRGVKKEEAKLDGWAKEVCPSNGLRKWFDHREDRFSDFAEKYREELNASKEARAWRKEITKSLNDSPVTLIYAAKSETINHARVLQEWIEEPLSEEE
ncbi:hypothetical protein PEPNEM18_01442 [Aedoeadaptatus nemausensis]|uniref:DUF488 domain-containing protein n=1 Tax=Aedoeadaptatus nemausensis TaxID=2582829 RepID=A0A6V6Y6W7_9FIRM|nr:DUF488 family protein [Peptoniphilus nemausensis]CAC9935161.1 hypothetical protein PEPNEM18_01442 [Peptoniphilus nemausensis]